MISKDQQTKSVVLFKAGCLKLERFNISSYGISEQNCTRSKYLRYTPADCHHFVSVQVFRSLPSCGGLSVHVSFFNVHQLHRRLATAATAATCTEFARAHFAKRDVTPPGTTTDRESIAVQANFCGLRNFQVFKAKSQKLHAQSQAAAHVGSSWPLAAAAVA